MAEYEIVENSSDEDYPSAISQARDALRSIDAQRTAIKAMKGTTVEKVLSDFGFSESSFGYSSSEGKPVEAYGQREQREDELKSIMEEDMMYSVYFTKRYGNFDVYFNLDEIKYAKGFNPLTDKRVSVKIAKEGVLYVADHVNPNQIIEELLSGVVSFMVIKVNGQVAMITGTLKDDLVGGEEHVRQAAFSLLPDGRVLLWNVRKEKWSSFYPDNLLEMIRDDTTDFE